MHHLMTLRMLVRIGVTVQVAYEPSSEARVACIQWVALRSVYVCVCVCNACVRVYVCGHCARLSANLNRRCLSESLSV